MTSMGRRLLFVISIACLVLPLGSCGGGGGKPFADIVWQVRCPEPRMREDNCPTNNDPRDINNLHNEDGHIIACDVERRGEQRILAFQVFKTGQYGIRAFNVAVARGGGPVQGQCSVRVEDDDNVYVGACGANPPTAAQPCQLGPITFGTEDGSDGVGFTMICKRLPNMAAGDRPRDVTRAMDSNAAFSVRMANCRGL
jgi:hypothetical protein